MQTINYKKWIYKFQILGLLSLLTACDPPATKALEQAAAPVVATAIQLAQAAATSEVKGYFDALNALDLKNPEVIQMTENILNTLNALAQSKVDAQKALDLLNTAKNNGDSNLATLKGTKKTEARTALSDLWKRGEKFENSLDHDIILFKVEVKDEFLTKVDPIVQPKISNLGKKFHADAKSIWEEVKTFK